MCVICLNKQQGMCDANADIHIMQRREAQQEDFLSEYGHCQRMRRVSRIYNSKFHNYK